MQAGYGILPMRVAETERGAATRASGLLDARDRLRLDDLALMARVAVGTGMAGITAIVEDQTHIIASSGTAMTVDRRHGSFCTFTIAEPSSILCIPDAQIDPRFAGNAHVIGAPWLRFYAGATLMTAEGIALGALCVFDSRPRSGLLAREARVLTELAAEVMRRLETGRCN